MRLSPVPIRFGHLFQEDLPQLNQIAKKSRLPSHRSAECMSACRKFALILAGLMHGLEREEMLSHHWEPFQACMQWSRCLLKLKLWRRAVFVSDIRCIFEALVMWWKVWKRHYGLFVNGTFFQNAILKSVNLGEDTDTTGVICGQPAGSFWGKIGIPNAWLTGLVRRALIERA